MRPRVSITAALAVPTVLCLMAAGPAHAGSVNCLSINGQTRCVHSEDTVCHTVGDRTWCHSRSLPSFPPSVNGSEAPSDTVSQGDQSITIDLGTAGQSLHMEQRSGSLEQNWIELPVPPDADQ